MKKGCFGCKGHRDKIGILIAQLGTPEAPTAGALRPYLRQFLSDPRVIEKSKLIWWPILYGIVLTLRPARSAKLYERIWTEKGSPLLVISQEQTEKLSNMLSGQGLDIEVALGMRYGEPSLERAIDSLIEKGCTKILLFPMYPQYSATTTASIYDVVFAHLLKRRNVPTLSVVEPYYFNPHYLRATASVINESLANMSEAPEKLVFSYHGIPEKYIERGDVYCCHCAETTSALIPLLDIDSSNVIHTYQSRFGRDPWLVPYTDETIEELAKSGVKRIAVACPGFTADCLETLDEMGNEGREKFVEAGGESLELIPCLNDSDVWIEAMAKIVNKEISPWVETSERMLMASTKIACPVKVEKARARASS